ncbi:hypothetical protein SEUCBS140593_007511 [Sporothrix eucalyptigena]|uniref:TauD/TfdA-like domain-containing protein n=1 Tax=Sporothrix eucalyptigena TaxID=1812306 RepID=A0ABP0CGK9_9PEZI
MSTTTTTTETRTETVISATHSYPQPIVPTGALDKQFSFEESTPVIGREYPTVNIDLAYTSESQNTNTIYINYTYRGVVSSRGVVFFRKQDNLTDDWQKVLAQKLGEATNKPRESTLHIHPLLNGTHEFGVEDNEISTISSKAFKDLAIGERDRDDRKGGAASWHSDIQFEPVPADYTSLRLTQLPSTGGDTLWASGYELYDRFSDKYQQFFEGLTATFSGDGFIRAADARPDKFKIYEEPRGNPANIGRDLLATHPVVRTNPVTGWKSIFAIGNFPRRINELSSKESKELLELFYKRIEENHDLQVRFKWRQENDFAIWDNRSAFHSATNDYDNLGDRFGHRTVGIGEKPYLDPNSKSRAADLSAKAKQ